MWSSGFEVCEIWWYWQTQGVFFSFFGYITRLNSGIIKIFDPKKWNLNMDSPDCRASKIIENGIQLGPISWELKIENTLFIICVGVCVGSNMILGCIRTSLYITWDSVSWAAAHLLENETKRQREEYRRRMRLVLWNLQFYSNRDNYPHIQWFSECNRRCWNCFG